MPNEYAGDDFYCDNVLSGKVEVERLLETANALAFRHTRPFWETHIVVIPKRHISSLLMLDNDAILIDIFAVIREIATEIVAKRGAARVLTNLGDYQDSKHLHFHVYSGKRVKTEDHF
jgi:histidine triad (HIT) family protein